MHLRMPGCGACLRSRRRRAHWAWASALVDGGCGSECFRDMVAGRCCTRLARDTVLPLYVLYGGASGSSESIVMKHEMNVTS